MNKNQEEVLLLASLEHFGPLRQWDKLIEEMAELQQAILKTRYHPDEKNSANLYEEIVDVEIVLAQLKTGLSPGMLELFKTNKLLRLEGIIKNAKSKGNDMGAVHQTA